MPSNQLPSVLCGHAVFATLRDIREHIAKTDTNRWPVRCTVCKRWKLQFGDKP